MSCEKSDTWRSSSYFSELQKEDKAKYKRKLTSTNGQLLPDPYGTVENWKSDAKPDVSWGDMYNYLVNSPSEYTHNNLKAYKSLEAFNFFVCNHVQDIMMKLQKNFNIAVSKQRYKNIYLNIFRLKVYFSLLTRLVFVVKVFVWKGTFHEYNTIFRSWRYYKVKMLGIIFLCEGQKSTCSHWQQCVYLSRSSHQCWACCTKKLFSTCGIKILEKCLGRCTFFSNAACWRRATLLKLTSFTGNIKGFWPQIQNSCKF